MLINPLIIIRIIQQDSLYSDILKTISVCGGLWFVYIIGSWISMKKLELDEKRDERETEKEKRNINENTIRQAKIFRTKFYYPLKHIKDTINNINLLTNDKNKLYHENKNIVNIKYINLPKPLQSTIKKDLYNRIIRHKLVNLPIWSKDLTIIGINKALLFSNIKTEYQWIILKYNKELTKLNNNGSCQICYNINEDMNKF